MKAQLQVKSGSERWASLSYWVRFLEDTKEVSLQQKKQYRGMKERFLEEGGYTEQKLLPYSIQSLC